MLLVALVVFGMLYLASAIIIGVLALLRRRGHGNALAPLSPGLLAPMGLIFGLLVGFLVADVWADRGDASGAVAHEPSALRDVDLLTGAAFPAEQPRVRELLREQIDAYVTVEWPGLSGGDATLTAAPPGLVEVQRLALGLLATAIALAMTLLCAQAAPFAGYFAIGPDVLLQVRP